MKISSWNVNSINIRLEQVIRYLEQEAVDVLALQETKSLDANFPQQLLEQTGYHVCFSGQAAYNGVAICSRSLAEQVNCDWHADDTQKRFLTASIDGIRIINVYIPNGQTIGCEKHQYKMQWLTRLRERLIEEQKQYPQFVLLGDYNIAPNDQDTWNPDYWRGRIMCSKAERDWFHSLSALGLHDSFREQHPSTQAFSWWDYRQAGFQQQHGLRIDHLLHSQNLTCSAAGVHESYRALERPSDHAPVWAELHKQKTQKQASFDFQAQP